MEFDKTKVFTALNADEVQVGSKVIVANDLQKLKDNVNNNNNLGTISKIKNEGEGDRFSVRFLEGHEFSYNLCFLVSPPEKKKVEYKIGDVLKKDTEIAMVTGRHISTNGILIFLVGSSWYNTKELESWEKVEQEATE